MRFISMLITLAILCLIAYNYLNSTSSVSPGNVKTAPAEYIDEAKQSTEMINKTIKLQQNQLNEIRKETPK